MAESIDIRELNMRIEQQSGFVTNLVTGMNRVIVGQKHLIDSLLISLLSDGHILLEGVPGLAKTLAIKTLSQLIDAEQMARHGLGGADVELVCCVAEHCLYGLGLGYVAHVGGRAVYVDVVYILRLQASVVECTLHHQLGAEALGMRCRDVVRVGAHALAHHLGVYLGAACLGVLELLEDEASCALAHDESVAARAEWA